MVEHILLIHRKSSKKFSPALQHLAIWSTCLRQILFCTEADYAMHQDEFTSEDHILQGEKSLALLLEISCGLHSPIVGETEVFGPFRQFVENRKTAGDTLFGDHQKWLKFIFSEVKKMRSTHLTGIGSQSYGSLLRRYTKELNSASLCGSGQLAQEILPWLAQKEQVQLICREPQKIASVTNKYKNLQVDTYEKAKVVGDALVIAAPLSDEAIMNLIAKNNSQPKFLYDLRGEENALAFLLAGHRIQYVSLHKFFAEIEENKKESQQRVEMIKHLLLERAREFSQRTELRPMGWDDLCA